MKIFLSVALIVLLIVGIPFIFEFIASNLGFVIKTIIGKWKSIIFGIRCIDCDECYWDSVDQIRRCCSDFPTIKIKDPEKKRHCIKYMPKEGENILL